MLKVLPLKIRDKTLLFPIIVAFILVIIVFGILLFSLQTGQKNTVPVTPTLTPNAAVTKVFPDEPETLTAGIPHTFLIYFNKNISIKALEFTLSYIDVTQDSPTTITAKVSLSQVSPTEVLVKTEDPIQERSEYNLTVDNPQTSEVLSSTTYLSGDIQPTKVPTNNLKLKDFLPYDTTSYTLEYVPGQNIYIFHFKFDPTNQEDITQQLQDAKSQAIQFIESKGVDINSIVIDYRSS